MRLARLLDEPERKVRRTIAKLEELSGHHSEDVRLLNDAQHILREKVEALGLDPSDTTGEELYQAMQVKLKNDLNHLTRAWGLNDNQSAKVIDILDSVASKEQMLAVKCSTMKQLLKALPPKKTMKLLGYRSLDSMMKREDVRSILAASLSNESLQWSSKLAHKVGQLKTSDYELRKIKFLDINPKKAEFKPVVAVPLMAAVCIDTTQLAGVMSAGSVLFALEGEALLTAENKQLTAHQFSKDFNKIAERLFSGYALNASTFDEDFLGLENYKDTVGTTEPYNKFSSLHPALSWWRDCGHAAFDEKGPVSLHIADCLSNIIAGANFSERYSHNFAASLRRQLAGRYLSYQGVKNYIGDQIDDTFITLESVSAKQLAPDFEEIRNL